MAQCEAYSRLGLGAERCKFNATHEGRWCWHHVNFHNHEHARNKTHGVVPTRGAIKNQNSPTMTYKKHLSPTLREAIDEQLNSKTPQEQLALYEELALMREAAVQAAIMFDRARNTNKSEFILPAADIMRSALKEVVSTAKAINDMESNARDKLSMMQVGLIIEQIVYITWQHFQNAFGHDHDDIIIEWSKVLREKIRLPTADNRGTYLTPDQDAADMDATVPRIVEAQAQPSANGNGHVGNNGNGNGNGKH